MSIYLNRQIRLMLDLVKNQPSQKNGFLACITAGEAPVRSLDVDYDFHSNPNFLYLTGFPEQEAALCLLLKNQTLYRILFCLPKNPERELWEGKRIGTEAALKTYLENQNTKDVENIEDIKDIKNMSFSIEEMPDVLEKLMLQSQSIYLEMHEIAHHHPLMTHIKEISDKIHKQLRPHQALHYFADIRPHINAMRLIKEPQEIQMMQKAADISVKAHKAVIQSTRVGLKEAHLASTLAYIFTQEGAEHLAYPSIVATGENTCILHHRASQTVLKEGDLVLVDAGCEYLGYAADITRTFPANGRFTTEQKAIYQIVDDAHHAAIEAAVAGAVFSAPHQAALKIIILGLVKLGLLSNPNPISDLDNQQNILDFHLKNSNPEENYMQFFMHRTSHYLGMDVHDVGGYKKDLQNSKHLKNNLHSLLEMDADAYLNTQLKDIWTEIKKNQQDALLKNNMVITIEPAIYIRPQKNIPQNYWNIGIRLENDIVINDDKPINLTADLPIHWQDIEELMNK